MATVHKVLYKTIELNDGTVVQIKYWANETTVYVAGFDDKGKQISVATYQATVEHADHFYPSFQQSLIEGLASTLESDLNNNPEMHLKK